MKELLKKVSVGLVAGAMTALPLAAHAEEADGSGASASLTVPVLSAYVWRGQVLNDEPVLQPTFGISKGGFTISWWGNFNLTDNVTGDDLEFSEHDISVTYAMTCPITGAGITLGVVQFDFPNQSLPLEGGNISLVSDTREAFISYALSDVLLSPTLTVNYDFKEAEGFYGALGISHGIELAESLSLNLGATLGAATSDWGDFYFGKAEGLTDWSVSASLPFAVSETVSLTPAVSYSALLGDAKDAVEATGLYYGEDSYVVASLSLGVTF